MSSFIEEDRVLPRVLSVQSHVVSGYVGNRAAVFPLQLLGFDVDFVNSVQFSNHTGYKEVKGAVMSGHDLCELTAGLKSNGLLEYDYLLTGYIGSESFLLSVLELLSTIQEAKSNCRYICDPVLGDEGRYYVPRELVGIYRSSVLPRAYMITPNQFEAELLADVVIRTEANAISAAAKLIGMGPEIVIITSTELDDAPGMLCCYATRRIQMKEETDKMEINKIVVRKKDAHFTGTGDCTAALLLAWTHLVAGDGGLGMALTNTIATIQSIIALIARKQAKALSCLDPVHSDGCRAFRASEFSVVEGKQYIESPPKDMFKVETWILDELPMLS